jgi:hypothetical protein
MRNGLYLALSLFLVTVLVASACDVQSGMSRKSVEKYLPSPTPTFAPTPTPEPIDPADILTVDTSVADGRMIEINVYDQKRSAKCDRYNRVQLNGDGNTVDLKGGCQQVMINGDRNKVIAEASMEYVLNGQNNTVTYTKFANGKRPTITDNGQGNVIDHAAAAAAAVKK